MASNWQERDRYGRDEYGNEGGRTPPGGLDNERRRQLDDERRYGAQSDRFGYARDFAGAGYADRDRVAARDSYESSMRPGYSDEHERASRDRAIPYSGRGPIGSGNPEGGWDAAGNHPRGGQNHRGEGYERSSDHGFFDRAGDEVASSFGNDHAAHRRNVDQGYRGRGPKNYTRSDDRIREDVSDRLSDDRHIDASDIEVSVNNCEVTLDGTVTERFAKRHAEDLAEGVSGVKHVQNNLRLREANAESSGAGAVTASGTNAEN